MTTNAEEQCCHACRRVLTFGRYPCCCGAQSDLRVIYASVREDMHPADLYAFFIDGGRPYQRSDGKVVIESKGSGMHIEVAPHIAAQRAAVMAVRQHRLTRRGRDVMAELKRNRHWVGLERRDYGYEADRDRQQGIREMKAAIKSAYQYRTGDWR